jgi:phosphomannomutase
MTATPELLDRARTWLAEDPDPQTRRELEELLARVDGEHTDPAALADLADRFAGRLLGSVVPRI